VRLDLKIQMYIYVKASDVDLNVTELIYLTAE
jgi:hypothetical protein